MTERLTTLAAVKEWLGIDSTDSDTQLIRLINAASQFVTNYLNWDTFAARDYVQNGRGNGQQSMLLRHWPVISVSSVGFASSTFTVTPWGIEGSGAVPYFLSDHRNGPASLELYGRSFPYRVPITISYRAGFEASQSFELETGKTVSPNNAGQWIANTSVTKNDVEMVKVDKDPVSGQYAVDDWGVYTFSDADAGSSVVIRYSYVPWDLSFAVTETIGEWYKRKDRIGVLSKTLGGQETITFSKADLSELANSAIRSYANVVPM